MKAQPILNGALALCFSAGLAVAQPAQPNANSPAAPTAPTAQSAPAAGVVPPDQVTNRPADANTTNGANSGPSNNAVNTAPANNPGAPVPGANSFTEGEARSRIEGRGYSSVSGLKLDEKGIWRGTASKDGKSVSVALDYQGNVVAN